MHDDLRNWIFQKSGKEGFFFHSVHQTSENFQCNANNINVAKGWILYWHSQQHCGVLVTDRDDCIYALKLYN